MHSSMLKSERIKAGSLMSLSGSLRRMFAMRPLWVAVLVMPFVWILWACMVCPIYYLGGWLFFKHGQQRFDLVDQQRHRELTERNVVG